ncbi:MAG: hypothetical protein FD125_422 [bacterium]|nr:MAG: hypothetical protein FD125_422 [bacterium]
MSRRLVFGVLAAGLSLALAGSAVAQTLPDRLQAEAGSVGRRIDGEVVPEGWTLSQSLSPAVFGVAVEPGRTKEVCFFSGENVLCRTLSSGQIHDLVISYEGVDYPTRIEAVQPPAVFDAAYQDEYRGRTTILIPEVYELVNIAIALTPSALANPGLAYRDTPYYGEVMSHFERFKDDPLIIALDAELKQDALKYFRLKMNGYAFEYDDSGHIVRSQIYDRTGFVIDAVNTLAPYHALLQAFSDRSGFRDFYIAHRPLYDEQIAYLRDEIDVAGATEWLQGNFPAVRPYDATKIIFSPLVGANQSLTTFDSNGFRELQPHVNFPYSRPGLEHLTPNDLALVRGTILFTEMNHGFIKATPELRSDIEKVFADRAFWTKAGSAGDLYSAPESLFNEYMNWALVSLYYHDKADAVDRDELVERVNPVMERRGFTQFTAFNCYLLDLYANRPEGATLADLYPQIVAWTVAYQAAPRPSQPVQ